MRKARCAVAWQAFDEAMWKLAFGGEYDFKAIATRVKAFMENREDMVVVCTDQVPVRANIQGGRQLYHTNEVPSKANRKRG